MYHEAAMLTNLIDAAVNWKPPNVVFTPNVLIFAPLLFHFTPIVFTFTPQLFCFHTYCSYFDACNVLF